jgi:hypothetical protein
MLYHMLFSIQYNVLLHNQFQTFASCYSSKNKQWSWNLNGTRHDKINFNPDLKGLETAKKVAREALGLDDNVILQFISLDINIHIFLKFKLEVNTSKVFTFRINL